MRWALALAESPEPAWQARAAWWAMAAAGMPEPARPALARAQGPSRFRWAPALSECLALARVEAFAQAQARLDSLPVRELASR